MRNNKFSGKRRKPAGAGKPNQGAAPARGRKQGGGGPRQPRKKKESTLDPNRLVQKAKPAAPIFSAGQRKFADLRLDKRLLDRIATKGFEEMTEIQDQTLDAMLDGRDVMGIAKTGTGKTGAFLIPILERLLTGPHDFGTLILLPTRELAQQVETEFKSLTKGLNLYSTCVIGGTNIQRDIQRLRRTQDFLIATPGRLIDLMNRKAVKVQDYSVLVLDEFDRMLDMGFVKDVFRIADRMHDREQTVLFSATENGKQRKHIDELLYRPVEIRTASGQATSDHIEQRIVRIGAGEDKFRILVDMLKQPEFKKVLIFGETKHGVSRLAHKLRKNGITSDEIHGNKAQNYRVKALNKFRRGEVMVLTATDVAARGIDIDDITHVINYQLPMDMESYIHRIGRTGRAGKVGHAITMVD